jgi:hypothetical protein
MPPNIILAASLPAPPDQLFDMYLDPVLPAAFTGARVTIAGGPVRRFGFDRALDPLSAVELAFGEQKRPVHAACNAILLRRIFGATSVIRRPRRDSSEPLSWVLLLGGRA